MKRAELEFLPAVLEVQETPPSPIGRGLLWCLLSLLAIAVVWACFSEIDIVAVGQGKIIPIGKSKTIQPLEIGVVKAILVSDGQDVKAGQALLELDPTQVLSDSTRFEKEVTKARLDVARERALIRWLEHPEVAGEAELDVPGAGEADRKLHLQLLRSQYQEYLGKHRSLEQTLAQRVADLAVSHANIDKLKQMLPLIQERANSLRVALERHVVSRNDVLEAEQQRIDAEQSLKGELAKAPQLDAAIEQAKQELKALEAETRQTHIAQLAEAERVASGNEQELNKSQQRARLQTLTAPIDGVVQQLAVTTVGGVVTPAQALMVIVPKKQTIEVDAYFETKDIGFIRAGQSARVKVDAFPFTRFGTVLGSLSSVSGDAIYDEKRGALFSGRVTVESPYLQSVYGKMQLRPGMQVGVEVTTGRRTVLQYLFEPVLVVVDESFLER